MTSCGAQVLPFPYPSHDPWPKPAKKNRRQKTKRNVPQWRCSHPGTFNQNTSCRSTDLRQVIVIPWSSAVPLVSRCAPQRHLSCAGTAAEGKAAWTAGPSIRACARSKLLVRGQASVRETAIRCPLAGWPGLEIHPDIRSMSTPLPHNGCRRSKRRPGLSRSFPFKPSASPKPFGRSISPSFRPCISIQTIASSIEIADEPLPDRGLFRAFGPLGPVVKPSPWVTPLRVVLMGCMEGSCHHRRWHFAGVNHDTPPSLGCVGKTSQIR